ncbi:MAG TPA: M20 family metallo-hydrolase [Candidatus Dormibacteraeota bacterium]
MVGEESAGEEHPLWHQLMALSEFREPDQSGWTRRLFSSAYQRSRGWVREQMAAAGLGVRVDEIGNILGELPGRDPGLPQIVLGSHTDTVAGGGRFDGMVGLLAAVSVARELGRLGTRLRHPLLVADFLGEEPNRFGISCVGSRAAAGQLSESVLSLPDAEGVTLGSALQVLGAGAFPPPAWDRDRLHCYLELHIEQGRQLEQRGLELGVVSAIAGIHRAQLTFRGRPDHAGTTAMADRRDALAAAAEGILLVEEGASQGGTGVGTVGRLTVAPGASNVIPGEVVASVELRSADGDWLIERHRDLARSLAELGDRRKVEIELEWISAEAPTLCHPGVRRVLGDTLTGLGHPVAELVSGASHDAAHMARITPMGMLFIPSRDGRSHCPEEWTEPHQVLLGAEALLGAVRRMDAVDAL